MRNLIRKLVIDLLLIGFGCTSLLAQVNSESQVYRETIEYVNQMIEGGATDKLLYETRAIAYLNLRMYELALGDTEILLSHDSKNSLWWELNGLSQSGLGLNELALDSYNQAIKLDSVNNSIYVNRGYVHEELRNFQQALNDYSMALRIDSNDIQALINKANLLSNDFFNDYVGSINLWDRVVRQNPSNSDSYNDRSLVYLKSGAFENALKDIEMAISLDSSVTAYYYNKARVLLASGKFNESMRNFEKAIELDSLDWNIYLYRSKLYRKLRKYDKEQEDLEKFEALKRSYNR